MAATIQKPSYGTSTAIVTTALATLAGSSAVAGWQSAVIDNSVDLALAIIIRLGVTLAVGSPSNDKTVYVYTYESEDGSHYTGGATGSEGTLSRRDPTNLRLIGTIACPDSGALLYEGVFVYAPPTVPRKWGLYVNNFTGLAFTAAAASYTPVQGTSI